MKYPVLLCLALITMSITAQKIAPIALADQSKGDPRILVMDYAQKDWSKENDKALLWSWKPADSGIDNAVGWTLPNDARLRRMPVWGDREFMVTCSGYGLLAVVSYPEKIRKWSINVGKQPNLHGIELLPNGNVAVAASTGGWVRIYTASQGISSGHYTEFLLEDAHNVLWDPSRNVLWALGQDQLVQLRVEGTAAEPQLTLAKRVKLPETSGHDLEAKLGDPNTLWITTGHSTWSFDKQTEQATRLKNDAGVKSINNQPGTGQLIETKPHATCTQNTWCTDVIEFAAPEDTRRRQMAVYRARLFYPDYL